MKGQEHSSWRRVREAGFSVWLELRYNKSQILKYYLDTVYLGAGAYGVEEAAQRYYAKPASELTLAESAVLAGIVKAPSRYAPNLNPDAAQMRAQQVLDAMENQGLASAGLLQEARNNPAKLVR